MPGTAHHKVIYTQQALASIKAIGVYIALRGYPETAQRFAHQLYEFGNTLGVYPEKFPLSNIALLAKRGLHVAVFRKNYVFVYKVEQHLVVVYNVVHNKTCNKSWV